MKYAEGILTDEERFRCGHDMREAGVDFNDVHAVATFMRRWVEQEGIPIPKELMPDKEK